MHTQKHKDISSRALKVASERKAKKIQFYQNGHPYQSKFTVSIIPGKDFHTFEQLCQYLTHKSNLFNGVQYIFTTNGRRVNTLDELEHGQSYVMSCSKRFHHFPYGSINNIHQDSSNMPKISDRYKFIREDDLRLLRPLSSKYNNVYANADQITPVTQNSADNRILTIVNNQDHNITARVILNLRSPKSFEILLRDLGQTVRMNFPKRMFTSSGQVVKSISHLKFELDHIDLFYIDSNNFDENLTLSNRYHSLESIPAAFEVDRVHKSNLISSYSSNIDLRPNHFPSSNFEFEKSIRSNLAVHNRLQPIKIDNRNDSSLHPAQSESEDKTVIANDSLHLSKNVKLKNNSMTIKKNNIEQYSDDFDKIKLFSIENISPEKYEQIQRYAEKMIEETSMQIKNEKLILHKSKNPVKKSVSTSRSNLNNKTNNVKTNTIQSNKSDSKHTGTNNSETYSKTERNIKKSSKPPSSQLSARKQADNKSPTSAIKNDKQSQLANVPMDGNQSTTSTGLIVLESKPISGQNIAANEDSLKLKSKTLSKNSPNQKKSTKFQQNSVKTDINNSNKLVSKSNSIVKSSVATIPKENRKVAPKPIKNLTPVSNGRNETFIGGGEEPNPIENLEKIATQNNAIKPEQFLRLGSNVPDCYLQLYRIFGYNGNRCKNLYFLNTGELAFYSGVFVIMWNPTTNKQRFYTEHDNDIYCMRADSKSDFIATSQLLSASKLSVIRIWSVKSLVTVAVLNDKMFNLKIIDMEFTLNNSLFVANSESLNALNISLWKWDNAAQMMSSVSKKLETDEQVFGGTVHPLENDILVTYGKMHLVVWHYKKDKTIDYRTALQTYSKIIKTIHCADFMSDNSLLTGDSNGYLTIWAPFEINKSLEFAIKEVKGHETQLTCLKLTKDHILISGDKEGIIKTWDVTDGQFRLLNALKLPSMSGSVCSITFPHKISDNFDIYVGTSKSLILKGSALLTKSYEIIFEGHAMAIRTASFDQEEDIFYTASLDQKVCKWNRTSLIWKSNVDIQGISSSVHPGSEILAVGSVNGLVSILDTITGETIQHLQISSNCIGCISYSPGGNFLAAGCQDGNLHVLPVDDNGRSYNKVSVLKGPLPILTLQWSTDTQFILTSVDDNNYQELILWDLPNTRYIRNVTKFSDNLQWYNPTCTGLEDARGTWDNLNLHNVTNICNNYSRSLKYIFTGDENGFVRLFSYPCFDVNAAFFEYKQGGGSVTDIKLSSSEKFVFSCNFEGSIILWKLKKFNYVSN